MSEAAEAFVVLILLVAIALSLPAKYDPAVRLKEWNERKRRTLEGK